MDQVLLVRHAESEFSVRAAVNGDASVACGLTPAGEEQARRLGAELASERIELCVTSEFERARRTAELALAGRNVPSLALAELNEIRAGDFEGGTVDEYREWAWAHGSGDEAPGGGESRAAFAARLARGFRIVLERPERLALVVLHSLPIAYVLDEPRPRMPMIEYARAYRMSADELRAAVERLEAWCAAPSW